MLKVIENNDQKLYIYSLYGKLVFVILILITLGIKQL